jgi:hypothetical protein
MVDSHGSTVSRHQERFANEFQPINLSTFQPFNLSTFQLPFQPSFAGNQRKMLL